MPAAITVAIINAGLSVGVSVGTSIAIASMVTSVIGGLAAAVISSAILPKPKRPSTGNLDGGRQEMIRQAITARRVIYGRAKVSGPIVYAETYDKDGTKKNRYFSDLVVVASHEIEAFDSIWFDDTELTITANAVTNAKYKNPNTGNSLAFIYTHLGTASQAADAELVAVSAGIWTSAHRLRGLAYVHKQLLYRAENWPTAPKIRAVIQGKKCFDPRTSTTIWTENPAICLRDYMISYMDVPTADIDDTLVNAAANICEEAVALAAGGTQDRYTMNGVVNLDQAPVDVIDDILSAMAGTLTFVSGVWKIYAGASTAANADELDEDDLSGPIKVMPRLSRRDIFNAVKAVYIDVNEDYQPTTAPAVTNATYLANDNGEEIITNLELPFTDDPSRAQRLAKIELERVRQQIKVNMSLKPGPGLRLQIWDVVNVSNSHFGWSSKAFRVTGWKMTPVGDVAVTLREEAAAMWSWSAEETAVDPAPDTNLPNPFEVAAPGGITITEELAATATGTVQTVLTVVVTEVEDEFVERYELQYKKSSDADYISLGTQTGTKFTIAGVEDGTLYDLRAHAINGIGVGSAQLNRTYTPTGQTAPPEDVANFAVNIVDDVAHLTWDAVSDVDLSHYRIRISRETAGATWASSVDLVPKVGRQATNIDVPAIVGTYLIKAVDLIGLESTNATVIVSTIAGVAGLNVIETVTEHSAFAGMKTNVVLADGDRIILDGVTQWDSLTGNWDDLAGLWDGVGGVQSTGTYDFDGTVDLGAVFTSRLTAHLKVGTREYADTWDSLTGNWDTLDGVWDGLSTARDVGAKLQVRTTEDDPGGAPTWSAWRDFVVGDYKARAFEFRAILTSASNDASPEVTELSVTVDMPDRVASGSVTTSSGAAVTVTFAPAFKAVPKLGFSHEDMATGDYAEITSKTASGFDISIRNSGGTRVVRNSDYLAKGYGEAA